MGRVMGAGRPGVFAERLDGGGAIGDQGRRCILWSSPLPTATRILVPSVPAAGVDLPAALARISAITGRGTAALGVEMLRAILGKQRLTAQEFVVQGAWLGDAEERRAYVGDRSNHALNRSLTDAGMLGQWSLMADKLMTGMVLEASGFPVPAVKAVYAADGPLGSVPLLRSAEALADWLADAGALPAFAKPVDGTMALGSVPLVAAGPRQVDIGGPVVPVEALAREVAALYPRGWLIQEQLRQPPEIEALIGPGIGTVRVVTLWEAGGPEVLYAVWRHPAPGTWVDAAVHGKPNVGCALDGEGRVVRARRGDLLSGEDVTHSPLAPDQPLIGYRLEQWPAMTDICRAAHRLFPGHALIGWDIAMTGRGPVISEVNANPLHMSYQRAFQRGFLHGDFRQRLDAARQLMRDRVARYARKRA